MILRLGCVALLLAGAACGRGSPPPQPALPAGAAPYAHALLVCVDGLRPEPLAEAEARGLRSFARLLRGAATLNARTDPDWTITLPNQVGMLSGRTVEGREGHHWRHNDVPPPELQLRREVRGVFDVVAAAGGRCALIADKEKFVLLPRSWNGADAGRAAGPLHEYLFEADGARAARALLDFWERAPADERSLAVLHLRDCDAAGHAEDWDLAPDSPYGRAVAAVDARLGEILAWLDARPARAARTALVLTSDHGGGTPWKNHHGAGHAPSNFIIPFLVWTGDGAARGDLYALAAGARTDPGGSEPGATGPPPVRNLDAANLLAALLGLGPVPGSTINARQDLRWREEPAP